MSCFRLSRPLIGYRYMYICMYYYIYVPGDTGTIFRLSRDKPLATSLYVYTYLPQLSSGSCSSFWFHRCATILSHDVFLSKKVVFHTSCMFFTDRCFSSQKVPICSKLVCCRTCLPPYVPTYPGSSPTYLPTQLPMSLPWFWNTWFNTMQCHHLVSRCDICCCHVVIFVAVTL